MVSSQALPGDADEGTFALVKFLSHIKQFHLPEDKFSLVWLPRAAVNKIKHQIKNDSLLANVLV